MDVLLHFKCEPYMYNMNFFESFMLETRVLDGKCIFQTGNLPNNKYNENEYKCYEENIPLRCCLSSYKKIN